MVKLKIMQQETVRAYKVVNIDEWPRKTTYDFFRDYADPFFNITANVEVEGVYNFCKQHGLSVALSLLYCSLTAANEVRQFRIRSLDDRLVEYDQIHATQTILNDDDTFSFAYFEMAANVFDFERSGWSALGKYKALKTFDVESQRIDLIYYSVIPWISFTSFKHASRMDTDLTIPKIVFGKIFETSKGKQLPVSVEVNHMIMDGLHVGRFFERFQARLKDLPEIFPP